MGALDTIKELFGVSEDEEEDDPSTFEERSISALADYQLGWLGTFRYEEDGSERRVERRYDVYIDEEYVDDDGRPVAELTEEVYEAGDDEPVETESVEFSVGVDPSLGGMRLKKAIASELEDDHRNRDPGAETRAGVVPSGE